ncbi:GlsB/YeaQ/YmgE family stress response membrane protein [Corynebacterium caspium]|uniref:GlsB/YeaQ/YmgE family stress response membrane protein n=1 Tax=Corynebacterium caspium TaxID=234828 RepID=UPI0003604126|nr:GlsB/YeaQ/YmgE family stress response membrane protein [Corynebacterium caspium]WKD60016.1 hypothetical protein CCASP_08205 [Corynebacterium caspium DSM 44850]
MTGLGFFSWIIVGGLAGWIASKIKGTDAQQGVFLNIVVGIVGGFIGGVLLGLFGKDMSGAGVIGTFISSLIGAVILLTIFQKLRK